MSEANLDVILRRRRRLPSWMSVGAANTENATSEAIDEDEQLRPTGAPSSKEVKAEGTALESETKKRTRKRSEIDKGVTTSSLNPKQTGLRRKEARSNDEGWKGGKRRTVSAGERNNLDQVDGGDGEMALTVGDLISIAREHVNADAEKRRQEAAAATMATTVDDSRTKFTRANSSVSVKRSLDVCSGSTGFISGSSERTLLPCSSRSSQAEQEEEHHKPVSMKRSLDVRCVSTGFISGSSDRTVLPCSSRSSQAEQEKEHHEPESFTLETTRTGDVAQDMLNLFLGPLLQKSEPSQRKLDNSFPCEHIKCSSSEIALAKMVEAPTEKKKSSLKDKVSLFLS